jgi:hypothetical protein
VRSVGEQARRLDLDDDIRIPRVIHNFRAGFYISGVRQVRRGARSPPDHHAKSELNQLSCRFWTDRDPGFAGRAFGRHPEPHKTS